MEVHEKFAQAAFAMLLKAFLEQNIRTTVLWGDGNGCVRNVRDVSRPSVFIRCGQYWLQRMNTLGKRCWPSQTPHRQPAVASGHRLHHC
jgi:hypothetical protein